VLILGGDMTGKAVVPFVHQGGKNYKVTLLEQDFQITNDDELADMQKRVRSRGYYPYLTSPDEIAELDRDPDRVHRIFLGEVLKVVQQWMDLADKKLDDTGMKVYCCPGNDDMDEVDDIVRASRRAMIAQLNDLRNAIFNIHVPPHKSGLDEAPELDKNLRPVLAGQSLKPVGSTALRTVIERYQPLLGLHGHIHEGRGSTKIGETLCINPGSMYEQGTLLGAIVKLGDRKIENYVLTSG
jgi:Icc-related predicted phosphoesterase